MNKFLSFSAKNESILLKIRGNSSNLVLLTQISNILFGLLSTALILKYFKTDTQGIYFTFVALVAFNPFFEFGYGPAMKYTLSHRWPELRFNNVGLVRGRLASVHQMISLARNYWRFYLFASLLSVCFLSIAGLYFFRGSNQHTSFDSWGYQWIAVAALTGGNLLFVPLWSILESSNKLGVIYSFKLIQSIFGGVAFCTAIYTGCEIWSYVIFIAISNIVLLSLTAAEFKPFIIQIIRYKGKFKYLRWNSEISHMQWKILYSWIAQYITSIAIVPIIYHFKGAADAGRVGITFSIIITISYFSQSLLISKTPKFGEFAAKNMRTQLNNLFKKTIINVLRLYISIAFIFLIFILYLNNANLSLSDRFLDPVSSIAFIFSGIFVTLSCCINEYARFHNEELFYKINIFGGSLILLVMIVGAYFYSLLVVTFFYLCVVVFIASLMLGLARFRYLNLTKRDFL